MKDHIHKSELKRLLKDSSESTITPEDELAFIRLVLRCISSADMSYPEALECVYVQLGDSINKGE